MSGSLAYGVGGGGLGRMDKEISFDAIKDSALFKKDTYKNPLKHLSRSRAGSKTSRSRGNSVNDAAAPDPTPPQVSSTQDRASAGSGSVETPHAGTETSTAAATPSTIQVSYHSLDSTSPSSQVEAILSLSNTIFNASSAQPTKYTSLDTWQQHLKDPTSIIFFATIPSPKSDADVSPIGFLYAYPRSPSRFSESLSSQINRLNEESGKKAEEPVMHVWLCGVIPEYRERGVFSELMKLIEEFALERKLERMSVSTFPERFPDMYKVLLKKGWAVEEKMEGTDEGKVILLKNLKRENAVGVAK